MKLAFVFNQAPRYVESSYCLFDKEFDITWCFGNDYGDIKEMDHSLLKKVRIYKTKKYKFNIYEIKDVIEIAKDTSFNAYVLMGDFKLLTMWSFPFFIRYHNPKAKIIFWTHGWYGRESFIKKIVKKIFFAPADKILLYGNYARNLMIEEGYPTGKLLTIHNSLDHHKQVQIRNEIKPSEIFKEHFHNDNFTIAFIGRLTKVKQLDLLIEAIFLLKKQKNNYNVIIIGDGEERELLKKITKEHGLDENVWFYGACYDEKQNAELLYNADLCVSPGNIGLTAMHALVFGCPVLTHNNFAWQMPEFESIKDGITGTFFKQHDKRDLASSISKWFRDNKDKREIIRQACYDEIDNFWTPEFELEVLKKALSYNYESNNPSRELN